MATGPPPSAEERAAAEALFARDMARLEEEFFRIIRANRRSPEDDAYIEFDKASHDTVFSFCAVAYAHDRTEGRTAVKALLNDPLSHILEEYYAPRGSNDRRTALSGIESVIVLYHIELKTQYQGWYGFGPRTLAKLKEVACREAIDALYVPHLHQPSFDMFLGDHGARPYLARVLVAGRQWQDDVVARRLELWSDTEAIVEDARDLDDEQVWAIHKRALPQKIRPEPGDRPGVADIPGSTLVNVYWTSPVWRLRAAIECWAEGLMSRRWVHKNLAEVQEAWKQVALWLAARTTDAKKSFLFDTPMSGILQLTWSAGTADARPRVEARHFQFGNTGELGTLYLRTGLVYLLVNLGRVFHFDVHLADVPAHQLYNPEEPAYDLAAANDTMTRVDASAWAPYDTRRLLVNAQFPDVALGTLVRFHARFLGPQGYFVPRNGGAYWHCHRPTAMSPDKRTWRLPLEVREQPTEACWLRRPAPARALPPPPAPVPAPAPEPEPPAPATPRVLIDLAEEEEEEEEEPPRTPAPKRPRTPEFLPLLEERPVQRAKQARGQSTIVTIPPPPRPAPPPRLLPSSPPPRQGARPGHRESLFFPPRSRGRQPLVPPWAPLPGLEPEGPSEVHILPLVEEEKEQTTLFFTPQPRTRPSPQPPPVSRPRPRPRPRLEPTPAPEARPVQPEEEELTTLFFPPGSPPLPDVAPAVHVFDPVAEGERMELEPEAPAWLMEEAAEEAPAGSGGIVDPFGFDDDDDLAFLLEEAPPPAPDPMELDPRFAPSPNEEPIVFNPMDGAMRQCLHCLAARPLAAMVTDGHFVYCDTRCYTARTYDDANGIYAY